MSIRIPAFLLLALTAAPAEEPPAPPLDKVPTGLRPLIVREPRKSNEVTVVLDSPAAVNIVPPSSEPVAEDPPGLGESPDSPPPAETAPEPSQSDDTLPPPPSVPANPKKQGVIVRVEKLLTPSGPVDPADVKLVTPFLAKLPSNTPKGWKLETVSTAPPFTREVEVATGSKITLNIRPHVLIPDTDGSATFPVTEPGYDSALGYRQTSTISAILTDSLQQMETDSKRMGDAIDLLQQLLVSLPKPAAPEIDVTDAPVAKPIRKP